MKHVPSNADYATLSQLISLGVLACVFVCPQKFVGGEGDIFSLLYWGDASESQNRLNLTMHTSVHQYNLKQLLGIYHLTEYCNDYIRLGSLIGAILSYMSCILVSSFLVTMLKNFCSPHQSGSYLQRPQPRHVAIHRIIYSMIMASYFDMLHSSSFSKFTLPLGNVILEKTPPHSITLHSIIPTRSYYRCITVSSSREYRFVVAI